MIHTFWPFREARDLVFFLSRLINRNHARTHTTTKSCSCLAFPFSFIAKAFSLICKYWRLDTTRCSDDDLSTSRAFTIWWLDSEKIKTPEIPQAINLQMCYCRTFCFFVVTALLFIHNQHSHRRFKMTCAVERRQQLRSALGVPGYFRL